MNPVQFYLAIAVAPVTTVIIVLVGVLLNNQNMNNRMAEVNNRLTDFRQLLTAETQRVEIKLEAKMDRLESRMDKMESNLLHQMAGLDARVSRIEEKLDIR